MYVGAAMSCCAADSPSQKNPIETSYVDECSIVMNNVEAVMGSNGVVMYFVVFNSSLCQ